MRAVEAAAIAGGAVTGLELMERAGAAVVAAILAEWPRFATGPRHAAVLCGPGNNGGDGFVIARLLRESGWQVSVVFVGEAGRLPPDAAANYRRWCAQGRVLAAGELPEDLSLSPLETADLFVDALFGTGLSRPIPGEAQSIFSSLFSAILPAPVVAVDIPSGLCADSGRPLVPEGYPGNGWPASDGLACEAQLTVAFHRAKPGHYLDRGPAYCGKLVVADIGLPAHSDAVPRRQVAGLARPLGLGKSGTGAHKFSYGHALVLSGPSGHGGAARLSARGALRAGAGLVTLACPPEALVENAARLDAVMLRVVEDPAALVALLQDRRINALCLGPGLGLGAREMGLVEQALRVRRATALDADALTLVAGDLALRGLLHADCVLTPHAGEFARLFPDIADRLAAPATRGPAFSRIDAVRAAAARAGAVVLLKGADTVIAAPDGEAMVSAAVDDRCAPWLATAGAGDVLSGFIAGLMAQGARPMQAAGTAAWLHVEAARRFGPGLIAEDLPEALPGVFRALGL